MGLIKCESHGLTSIIFACSHIYKNINSPKELTEIIVSKLVLGGFLDNEISFTYAYCIICAEKYSLPYEGKILSEELVDEEEFDPVCGMCFTEFKQTIETS